MIEDLISEVLNRVGHLWILDSGLIEPDSDDVKKLLDEAAAVLYDRPIGARFEAGRIIIDKTETGFDTYVFAGSYY